MTVRFRLLLRTLRRQRIHSTFAFISLFVATLTCLILATRVFHELNYDRWGTGGDRIFRVNVTQQDESGDEVTLPVNVGALGPGLQQWIPGVAHSGRLTTVLSEEMILVDGINHPVESAMADRAIADIFGWTWLHGDREHALRDEFSSVFTESAALRLFGEVNAVGRTFTAFDTTCTVTAVIADLPTPNHLRTFDFYWAWEFNWCDDDWIAEFHNVYALLEPGVTPAQLQPGLDSLVAANASDVSYTFGHAGTRRLELEPVRAIHFNETEPNTCSAERADAGGGRENVLLFAGTAALILFIAILNFLNLITGKMQDRGRLVGIAKLFGARRRHMTAQFAAETALVAGAAVALALVTLLLDQPRWLLLAGVPGGVAPPGSVWLWTVVAGAVFALTVAGSLLPTLKLSSFTPRQTLLSGGLRSSWNFPWRRAMVIFQFTLVTVLLLILTGMYRQIRYVQLRDPGFDQSNLLDIRLHRWFEGDEVAVLRHELLALPDVHAFTATKDGFPQRPFTSMPLQRSDGSGAEIQLGSTRVAHTFPATFGIEMAAGRWYREGERSYSDSVGVVNETAARKLGIGEGLPVWVTMTDKDGEETRFRIVGVIRDYHYESLFTPVQPLFLYSLSKPARHLFVRYGDGSLPGLMANLEDIWTRLKLDVPLDAIPVQDAIQQAYETDRQSLRLSTGFLLVAFVLAALGLFSYAHGITEARTKELAIRKVFGASVEALTGTLLRSLLRWVVIAQLIAAPVAWLLLQRWLERYAYRVGNDGGPFLLVVPAVLLLSTLVVIGQVVRVAKQHPMRYLRRE